MTEEGELDSLQLAEQFPQNDVRCRICYMENRPLVALCECAGSIAYVHEECIIDWINLKISQANGVYIPSCEICHATYSANLQVGPRKFCLQTLKRRVSLLKLSDKWLALYYCIGIIICSYLILKVLAQALCGFIFLFLEKRQDVTQMQLIEKPFETLFTHLILTSCFMREAIGFTVKLSYLVHQSYIQVVQLIIEPKRVIY